MGVGGDQLDAATTLAGVHGKTHAPQAVSQLEATGYVRRAPDPVDARARLVTITDKGLALRYASAAQVASIEQQRRKHLGAKRYDDLRAALVDLLEIADPYR